MKTLLDLFLGSLSTANPLKRFKWIRDPSEVVKIEGEMTEDGTIKLYFDSAIITEIDAVALALNNRGKQPPCRRPCKFGFGAQYSFYHYSQLFLRAF